ncbi:hypothetical protein, partial [Phocaeicola sartorii]|uniref:hypothetical protein n=1 Tax=Phocaeicola sartorii TaxID=671267 RepID=UPI00248AFD9C
MKRQGIRESINGITQITGAEFILFVPFIIAVMHRLLKSKRLRDSILLSVFSSYIFARYKNAA